MYYWILFSIEWQSTLLSCFQLWTEDPFMKYTCEMYWFLIISWVHLKGNVLKGNKLVVLMEVKVVRINHLIYPYTVLFTSFYNFLLQYFHLLKGSRPLNIDAVLV